MIEFAAAALEMPSWNEREVLDLKIVFDESKADPEALRVNHYDRARWSDAVRESAARDMIAAYLERHATIEKTSRAGSPYYVARLCGHNSRFDAEFLYKWFKREDEFLPAAAYEVLDTLALAHWCTYRLRSSRPPDFKLGTLCTWLGIAPPTHSDAIGGVRATAALAKALLVRLRDTAL